MTDYIPYNQWAHQHDEKIKAEYSDKRTADLADEVERNYYTVSRKAKRLGVQKSEAFMRSSWAKGGRKPPTIKGEGRKRFRAAADVYLKERFADTANEVLAQLFGVDVKTVRRWARRLGLQKTEAFMQRSRAKNGRCRFYTPEQEAYRLRRIAEVYPDGTEEELQALARELGIKRHSLAKLALDCGVRRSPEKVATARRKNSFKTKYGPDFIAALADYYPTHSNKECAEHFGMKEYILQGLASRFNIRKTKERRAQSQRDRWKKE